MHTHLQRRQGRTALQRETPIWVAPELAAVLDEAVGANPQTLQRTQSHQVHFPHVLEAVVAHSQRSKSGQEAQIQHTPALSIAATIAHHQLLNAVVKHFTIRSDLDSPLQVIALQPLAAVYQTATAIILRALSPSPAVTPLAFIFDS